MRRWFCKSLLFESEDSYCKIILGYIDDIYKLEQGYKGLAPEEIKERRQKEVIPILKAMKAVVDRCLASPDNKDKELFLKALGYAQAEYDGILRYTERTGSTSPTTTGQRQPRGTLRWDATPSCSTAPRNRSSTT